MVSPRMHIRKNDQVIVINGKDKGKIGRVMKVFPKESRVLIEKMNLVKRHTKPSAKNRQGGIIEKEAPIHSSKVMLLDPKTKTGTRVAYKFEDGKKLRISKKSKELIESK